MGKYIEELFSSLNNTVFSGHTNSPELSVSIPRDGFICGIHKPPSDMLTDTESDYDKGIELLLDVFTKHKQCGSRVFFVGNGGSSAIASHMTADFMKNGGMNTYSLYDNAVTTCMGNDYGYEHIFSKPLEFLIKKGDLLVAISSSGNSQNIINAISVAKDAGAEVVTFTGFDEDNRCRWLGDINVYVPCHEYGKVETIHLLILQQVVDMILERDGARI